MVPIHLRFYCVLGSSVQILALVWWQRFLVSAGGARRERGPLLGRSCHRSRRWKGILKERENEFYKVVFMLRKSQNQTEYLRLKNPGRENLKVSVMFSYFSFLNDWGKRGRWTSLSDPQGKKFLQDLVFLLTPLPHKWASQAVSIKRLGSGFLQASQNA